MNKVILMGRLTKDPIVKYTDAAKPLCIARYTLAVDRRVRRDQQGQQADFISCVAFGKAGEFAEKYCHKGTKLAITGRIQTGSYTNRDGQKVYTTEVAIEDQEFAESKNAAHGVNTPSGEDSASGQQEAEDGFMNIPDGTDEELPFS